MIALTSFLQVLGVLKLQKSWSVTDINIWKIKLQIGHYLFRSLAPSGGENIFLNYCKRLVKPWTMLCEPISSDLQHQSWQVKLVIFVSTAHKPNTTKYRTFLSEPGNFKSLSILYIFISSIGNKCVAIQKMVVCDHTYTN